jgi:hypothetical protein
MEVGGLWSEASQGKSYLDPILKTRWLEWPMPVVSAMLEGEVGVSSLGWSDHGKVSAGAHLKNKKLKAKGLEVWIW